MLARLADEIRLKGSIGRLDFLVGLISLLVAIVLVMVLWPLVLSLMDDPAVLHFSAAAVFTVVVWCVIALLVAARLRRLEWPVWLAFLPVAKALTGTPLLIRILFVAGDFVNIPLWFLLVETVIGASTLILVVVLLVWDEAVSRDLLPRHRAILLLASFATLSFLFALKGGVYQATLEDMMFLPTLTKGVLPLVHITPYFLVGAIPAIVVVLTGKLPAPQVRLALSISAAVFVVFVVWLWILWLALALPVNMLNAVM